jgi:hypothetical protein
MTKNNLSPPNAHVDRDFGSMVFGVLGLALLLGLCFEWVGWVG